MKKGEKTVITNKTKSQKTTEIYFDETPAPVIIRTHNTALKKRLLAFAEKFPSLCRLTDDVEGRIFRRSSNWRTDAACLELEGC